MLRLKGCQRCGGDVAVSSDWHGDYLQCLQCGWHKDTSGDPVQTLARNALSAIREELAHRKAS